MTAVEITSDGFTVDAALLADAFEIDAAEVLGLMRSGAITSVCEKGVEADAGRWRLTFRCAGRALRLTVDEEGNVLSRARFSTRASTG